MNFNTSLDQTRYEYERKQSRALAQLQMEAESRAEREQYRRERAYWNTVFAAPWREGEHAVCECRREGGWGAPCPERVHVDVSVPALDVGMPMVAPVMMQPVLL